MTPFFLGMGMMGLGTRVKQRLSDKKSIPAFLRLSEPGTHQRLSQIARPHSRQRLLPDLVRYEYITGRKWEIGSI